MGRGVTMGGKKKKKKAKEKVTAQVRDLRVGA